MNTTICCHRTHFWSLMQTRMQITSVNRTWAETRMRLAYLILCGNFHSTTYAVPLLWHKVGPSPCTGTAEALCDKTIEMQAQNACVHWSYLESEVELFQCSAHLVGEHVHTFRLLEGDHHVRSPLLRRHLRHDFHHVKLLRQLLHDVVQDRLDLQMETLYLMTSEHLDVLWRCEIAFGRVSWWRDKKVFYNSGNFYRQNHWISRIDRKILNIETWSKFFFQTLLALIVVELFLGPSNKHFWS